MARRISSPVLIDRAAELHAFEMALQEARDGRPGLIVLGGEAGAGKSRLVAEWAARTRAVGGSAVIGSAPPPAGAERTPFAALTQVLRALVRSMDARLIDRRLGAARLDLAALLPELGEPPPAGAEHDPFASTRLAEAVLVAIEAAVRQRSPLLIVLEDLHWADDATRGIVTYLARNLVDSPLVIAITYRSDIVHADEALPPFLAELGRFPGAERIELGPLEADAIEGQVRAILGTDPAAEVMRALVRRADGNPFFVEELLAAIIEGGVERPPPSVRTIVEARLARLGVPARGLVEAAAIAGAAVPVELLARATSMTPTDFDAALREARDGHLLAASAPTDGAASSGGLALERVDLRHVLVREVIVEALSAPRRRELHASLAAIISAEPRLAGDSELERVSRLAGHLVLAGESERAIPVLLHECAAAEEAGAFQTADAAYRRALALWRATAGAPPGGLDAAAVLERAAQAASLVGDGSRAVDLAREALALAESEQPPDDPDRVVRLRLHLGGFLGQAGDRDAALATLARAASAAPADSLLRARCGVAWARQLVAARRYEEAAAEAGAAAVLAQRSGDRAVAAQGRAAQAVALSRLGRIPQALDALQASPRASPTRGRGLTSTSRPSRFAALAQGHVDRALVLDAAGDPRAAARAALDGQAEADRLGLSVELGAPLAALAARQLLRTGAWEEVARLVGPDGGASPAATPQGSLVRALLATWRGAWEEADASIGAARSGDAGALAGWRGFGHLVDGELACWRRRFVDARSAVARGLDAAVDEGDRTTLGYLAVLGLRVEAEPAGSPVRGDLAAAREEAAAAHWVRLRAWLDPGHDGGSPARAGPGGRDQALLALGRAELSRLMEPGDADAWRLAVAAWDEAGDPFASAYSRWRLAEALLGQGGDRTQARESLRAALLLADGLGAAPLASEIGRLARRARLAGLADDPRAPAAPRTAGHAEALRMGLSERETEVLELLAEGLSDREIGERLFITTKTTGHHVSHILTKLGVERRGEAAAIAFRIGLAPPGG
jgi:DNA-binding CsgD family transcriptional regulator